jgi:hypothetical protein
MAGVTTSYSWKSNWERNSEGDSIWGPACYFLPLVIPTACYEEKTSPKVNSRAASFTLRFYFVGQEQIRFLAWFRVTGVLGFCASSIIWNRTRFLKNRVYFRLQAQMPIQLGTLANPNYWTWSKSSQADLDLSNITYSNTNLRWVRSEV